MSFPQVLTGVAHIGIPTNDLDKTIAFYKKLGFVSALETVNKAAGERVAFLQLGDLMIETYENHRAAEKVGAIDHVALATTDIEAAFAAAKEAGIINIITLPLISAFGGDNAARGYLLVTVLYGGIFTLCHWFCFAKTKEVVQPPERKKVSLKKQLDAALQNKPYLIALAGQFLFGVTLYGRNADLLYYFKYVEGNENLFTIYSMILIVPSILGAAAFPFVFEKLGNKGHTASLFAAGTGVSLIALYFFSAVSSPIPFYTFAALSQFFFCGFNTAIYAIVPDCVEYGEWKTGVRNDGFQYAFVSLGNKLGMAIGTSALAGVLSALSFAPNQVQNAAVQNAMHYAFSLLPGALWLVTAIVLFFYRISKRSYNQIMSELNAKKAG